MLVLRTTTFSYTTMKFHWDEDNLFKTQKEIPRNLVCWLFWVSEIESLDEITPFRLPFDSLYLFAFNITFVFF